MTHIFKRHEFYELVWSKRAEQLAEKLEITAKKIARVCSFHLIPFPSKSYWTKLDAGEAPPKTPLRDVDNDDLQIVDLAKPLQRRSTYVTKLVEAAASVSNSPPAKQPLTRPSNPAPPKQRQAPPIPELFCKRIQRLHPAAQEFDQILRDAKPDFVGEVGFGETSIHPLSRGRVSEFLHHLATELDAEGIAFRLADKRLQFSRGPDVANVYIKEQRTRSKHEPTSAELRARELARNSYGHYPWPRVPEFDYHHSGKLVFEIRGYAGTTRRCWSDAKLQTLESAFQNIKSSIVARLVYVKEARLERERAERERAHKEHRLALSKGRIEREAKRMAFLRQLAEFQREASDLRIIITQINAAPKANTDYDRMLIWANDRLAHLDSLQTVEAVTEILRQQKLFPEVDELHDPEGDLPV